LRTLTPFQIWASVLCPGSSVAAMANPAAQAHCPPIVMMAAFWRLFLD